MNSRGCFGIGLENPKFNENISGVLRSLNCFDGNFLNISGRKFKETPIDTAKAWKTLPVFDKLSSPLDVIGYGMKIVTVEFCDNSICLSNFIHPENAFYVFGREDSSVSNEIMEKSDFIVKIPTKFCLNLASSATVVMADRKMKQVNKERMVF